jgi:rare lipoprotein A
MIRSPRYIEEMMVAGNWQDHVGTVVAGRYTLRTLVYAGSRQAEFLAATPDQGEGSVSVALMEPDPGEMNQDLAAIDRAKQLQHPNLLHVLDGGTCAWDGAQVLYIVTEAAEGTLGDAPAEVQARPAAVLDDLLPALEWLHGQGLVYRNLDQDTVVRAGGRWKLADLSRLHAMGQFEPCEETTQNTPPEAARGWMLPAWDVWGLGVLLRDALAREGRPMPAPFDAIVRGCLEPDYRNRISLEGIRSLLEPAPVAHEAPREEDRRRRSRAWIAIAAVTLVACGLAVAWWPRHRAGTTPPVAPVAARAAPPMESKPAQPEARQEAAPAPIEVKPAAPAEPVGRADFFGDDLEGHPTASGEMFSNQAMTAASQEVPLGTRLRVTNLKNGHSAIVRVNDRGVSRRFIIRVTRRVAEQLGFVNAGSATVKLQVLK